MDALTLLRQQAETANNLMTQVFANVTAEQALWQLAGATTNPIAATFLHVYHSEDRMVHRNLGGRPTIFDQGGWQERLGYDPASPWTSSARPDLDAYRAYAAEVSAVTRAYLSGLDPDALTREVDTPRGPQPLANRLSILLVAHKLTHLGEISALLGCQGAKGFPF